MRQLHRYYLRELAAAFLLAFSVLYAVALLVAVSRWTYHSAGLDTLLILQGMLLWSIEPLPHLIPVALLLAVVLVFGRAAADNEILAVRMGGIHLYQVLLPAVLLGLLLSAVNAWLLADVIPTVYYRKHRLVADVASQFFVRTNPVNNQISLSDFRMLWERKEEGRFRNVWVEMKKAGICGRADEVWVDPPERGKVRVSFRNFRGVHDAGSGGDEVLQGYADEIALQVDVVTLILGQERRLRYNDMTTSQLAAEVRTGRIWKPELAVNRIHTRMCLGIAGLLLALVGAPVGILFSRGSRTAAFGISFFPLLLFYALVFLGDAVVAAGGHPVAGAWLPAAALGAIALALNLKVWRR